MSAYDDLPEMAFASAAAWEAWLEEHHAESPGVRLRLARKGSGIESVSQADAVEVALCFGWIDGRAGAGDETHWLLRFGPRRRQSKWSKINRARALELIERGAMRPAGMREIEAAKADGRWDAAYDPQRTATPHPDFQAALAADASARAAWDALDRRNRYAMIVRVQDAKRPETRARRIAQFVELLREGGKLYP